MARTKRHRPLTTSSSSSTNAANARPDGLNLRGAITRSRRRMLASSNSRGQSPNVADEAQEVAPHTHLHPSGLGKAMGQSKNVSPSGPHQIPNEDERPFPIMELPPEIRLEIYRACLTRPYNILLSRRELPPPSEEEEEASDSEAQSDPEDTANNNTSANRSRQARRSRTRPSTGVTRHQRSSLAAGSRGFASRSVRQNRTANRGGDAATTHGTSSTNNHRSAHTFTSVNSSRPSRSGGRRARVRRTVTHHRWVTETPRNQDADPLVVNILLVNKHIYKEARSVLYSENVFTLDLNTAMATLACLHQRSRRQIKHVELEIPSYNDILERFQETVRLSLRYCSGLKTCLVHMPFTLPGADGSGTTGNTTVYANGFDILRWLPQECDVTMKGNICTEIETVVNKHLFLAKTLDKLAYARRQLISNDTGTMPNHSMRAIG